jgi:uncharacterized protein YfaS (alpha-2-macroglobulin family)
VFNSTDEALTARVTLDVTGPLELRTSGEPVIALQPKASGLLWVRAAATGVGAASIAARAEAASSTGEVLTSTQETALAVRPGSPLHAESQMRVAQAGEPLTLEPGDKWMPGTVKVAVCVGARPTVHLQPAVEALIDYPYGCAEQTTSRLLAMLHAPELLKSEPDTGSRPDVIAGMIDAGIARLWSMQTRSGGLGYWAGDSSANLWASLYAAEFLTAAQDKGHIIDATFASELARYLESRFENATESEQTANLRAHLCYVLARMKRPPEGWISALTDKPAELDMAGRAHLAGAWLQLGRKDRAVALLSDDVLSQSVAAASGSRLTSQVHQESVLLSVLLDLDANHAWIPALVARLEKARQNGCWGSTLENAGALAALARYQLAGTEPASFDGTLRQGDVSHAFSHASPATFTFETGSPIELHSTGSGKLFVSITTEGLLADAETPDYDRNLAISRRWLDRKGEPIDPQQLHVGDLVLVEVTIDSPSLRSGDCLNNVAIVDALPGGLEVENPRLNGSETDGPADDLADHVEFRDDRVIVFTSVTSEPRVFRYALRAMTAGSFALPPVQASCMYDASFASIRGAGQVSIAR